MLDAQRLNADGQNCRVNGEALRQKLLEQGDAWYRLVQERCPHLFADVPVFISPAQLQQMTQVIKAIGRALGGQLQADGMPLGVFYGYDFHLNSEGAHLIEINTNAGGAFLNVLLVESQCGQNLPGDVVLEADPDQACLAMFRREWNRQRGDIELACIAIVDQQPEAQYLYPEFLLAQRLFERNGIRACIADPSELQTRDGGLYFGEQKVDMVYNRLTDFSLQQHADLLRAYLDNQVVMTPNPAHYARYADKRNLAWLTDPDKLRGLDEADILTLQAGIPNTIVVRPELETFLWDNRKQLFFKPNGGYGSRGAYRGEKLTRRVFGEIIKSDYVAQQIAAPGERCIDDAICLKYDVRCYVYDGKIQLVVARLYQGQTTNFRTAGGGFAEVRVAG